MLGGSAESAVTGEEIAYYATPGIRSAARANLYHLETGRRKYPNTYSLDALRAYQFWTQGLPEVDAEGLVAAKFLNKHCRLGRPHSDSILICEEHNGILRELVEVQQPLKIRYVLDGVRFITHLAANTMVRKRHLDRIDLDAHTIHFSGNEAIAYTELASSI